ncbi:DUF4304 domain-containing protein [Peribacillus acanthi]|uniref:DUF4304 domain-containing protein n=1 Tax=Peribacillus acanthi TaxID=2171554 RepID=UPI000D3E8C84|nr:DUF4304 domain-containing protein [Peribacillus acanthi]
MSMQNVLKQIIKDIITPLFKKNGFKKSGNNFAKVFADFTWTVNIQLSRHNSQGEVEFTINTGIYSDKLFGTLNEWNPPSFPTEKESVLRARINEIKGESDNWYKLNSHSDVEKLKEQLQSDIVTVLLPYFEQFQTMNDIIKELEFREEQGIFENPHHITILYRFFGSMDKAQNRIKKVYLEQELNSQKEFTKELAGRLGLTIECVQ